MNTLPKLLLIAPLAALALGGCLEEHPGDCDAPNNLELAFTYNDAPGVDFTTLITSVDVVLYDEQGNIPEHRRASPDNLSARAGMTFNVPPGKYYAVAWGNVRSNSSLHISESGIIDFGDCFIEIDEKSIETGDPVYYAPHLEKPAAYPTDETRTDDLAFCEIDVLPGVKTVKVLDFVLAHRTVNVWIKDYRETIGGQNVYPVVALTDAWSRYDFFFTTQPLRRSYTQQSRIRTALNEPYAEASFYTGLGTIDDKTDITLTSPSNGGRILSVNLKQFVEENRITDTDVIDILITFLPGLGITITVPEWKEVPVQPTQNQKTTAI